MTARKQKIGNVPLLALLAVTILINIPFLSGRLLFVLDTLQKFTSFHFIYSHLFFHDELPRWIPLINYGVPSDLQLFFMLPTDLAVMFVGWMLGIRDALFLFKVGMILAQMLFIYGFYLLCRRLFRSTLTVVLVCLCDPHQLLALPAWLHVLLALLAPARAVLAITILRGEESD